MSQLLLGPAGVAPVTDDPILLHAFARRGRPLSAGDLLRAMAGTGARISDVMAALAAALRAGLVAPRGHRADAGGAPAGPLLYDLTDDGWAAIEADRQTSALVFPLTAGEG